MAQDRVPNRVLLKLSGGVFAGPREAGFDEAALEYVTAELQAAAQAVQMAVVVGGGNVIRGARFCPSGPGRLSADYAGMLATVVNALVLRDRLERAGVAATCCSAFAIPRMVPAFEPGQCVEDLEADKVVLLAGGTGCPLFTTDTAAALRAVEVGASVVLKATRVDGVFSADPEKDPRARLYDRVSCQEVLDRKLGVMDLTAVSFCLEHRMPVRVFNYAVPGNIRRAARGEAVGTLIQG